MNDSTANLKDGMLKRILGVFHDHDRFVITTHKRPDGDAIGSQLALGKFLNSLGKEVLLFNTDPVPTTLDWMNGSEEIRTGNTLENLEAVSQADVFIVVDANARDRLGTTVERALDLYTGPTLLIDHHTAPESWFTWMLRDEHAAATAELIYDLICTNNQQMIDADIATALYTGMMTDTGSFRYSTVTPKIHRIIADLLKRGSTSPQDVYGHVYENHSHAWPRLVSLVFRGLTFLNEGKLAYITVTRHMLDVSGVDHGESHQMSDLVMSIAGVEVMLMLTELSHGVKASFRSKGDHHVDGWARTLGGGGHQNAAGAYIQSSMEDALDRILNSIPDFFSDKTTNLLEEDQSHFNELIGMKP